MWTQSSWARNQLRQSHGVASKVEVLQYGRRVATLDLVDGEVTGELRRPVLWNVNCSIVDPTGELSDGDIDDLLSPYEAEIAPYRGVVDPITGYVEYAPLGVFKLTGRDTPGDGSVSVSGQDRAIMYQGSMAGPTAISAGTPVEQAIATLLLKRNPALTMNMWKTGFTCGPLLYAADIDVWAEALKLAQSAGGWLWHTRTGMLTFGPSAPPSVRPSDRYAAGDGRLLTAIPKDDSDTVRNIVVAESTKTAGGSVIRAVVEDIDPTSPTNVNGPYGRRPMTVTNPHIASIAQAQQVAAAEFTYALGRSQITTASVVPDPWKDPGDIVTIHRPEAGLIERPVTIEGIKIPLRKGNMTITSTRSILTRDGRVLDMPVKSSL